MFCYIKFFLFLISICGFGFTSLVQVNKIKSLVLLIPSSIIMGTASYLFLTHILSFIMGPQSACIVSLLVLIVCTITLLITKRREFLKIENEFTKNQLISLILLAISICTLTWLATSKFGIHDKEFHIPVALSIFHNNIYPPKDFYRPEYLLLYHYGGDILAGAINHICKIEILSCYELTSTIFSGTTFLCFFALAWLITNSFQISILSAFCTYFGGGLLWLDAIIRYLSNTLPANSYKWDFLQTLLNIGIHGGIIDAPSVGTFVSTSSFGNPLLIFSLILFWKFFNETNIKIQIANLIFLTISLFSLFITAEWLYMTFWAGIIPFLLFQAFKRKNLGMSVVLLISSIILNKTLGNALFLQDSIHHLGRANIFNIGIKEKLFWVTSWGRLSDITNEYRELSCFSWDFISEFGLSMILFPLVIIYLFKERNKLAILLFLCSIFTMSLPVIIDFKINPVDANRFFGFGNSMCVMLIIIGINKIFNSYTLKKFIVSVSIIGFTLSPVTGLVLSSIFSPYIYLSKPFVHHVFNELKKVKSIAELQVNLLALNTLFSQNYRFYTLYQFKNIIQFLKEHSKPNDVAISSSTDISLYAGIYTLIPANAWLYKDLLYSPFDSIYLTTLTTLDYHLLNELNIKWVILSNRAKHNLPQETQKKLLDNDILNLVYIDKNNDLEVYYVKALRNILQNTPRQTAWLLVNKTGNPIEPNILQENKISLFSTSFNALSYLSQLIKLKLIEKNELVTSQAVEISKLEEQINKGNLGIALDRRF